MDPVLSLAFGIKNLPGGYALLLGSGLSSSAGILTGWGITLDLIQKVADAQQVPCTPDAETWYQAGYHREPDYSEIIGELARLQPERQVLLKSYFEPTLDERRRKVKVPTDAHRAIADLVESGHVRVILTTNFDDLMEQALVDVGVQPTVVSTANDLKGARPLVHDRCTVVKLHGDYRDARIKNTASELARYEPKMNGLLDRIFDEYGLVVCGWSARWDKALCAAIKRCKTRRYSTYWAIKGTLTTEARDLIAWRDAAEIPITDADSFFVDLSEKVHALARLQPDHPMSVAVASATLKRHLDDGHSIRAHTLVHGETERLRTKIIETQRADPDTREAIRERLTQYDGYSAVVEALLIVGGAWGTSEQAPIWCRSLERLADYPLRVRQPAWQELSRYPALRGFYAAGVAAVATDNYETLAALFAGGLAYHREIPANLPLARILNSGASLEVNTIQAGLAMDDPTQPYISTRLFRTLREPLREYLPLDETYQRAFDRFELLLAITCVDLSRAAGLSAWGPLGLFAIRGGSDGYHKAINALRGEVDAAGRDWPLVKAGLFDNDPQKVVAAIDAHKDHWRRRMAL